LPYPASVGTTPLPIQLFDYLRFSFDPTPAVAGTISIAITALVALFREEMTQGRCSKRLRIASTTASARADMNAAGG